MASICFNDIDSTRLLTAARLQSLRGGFFFAFPQTPVAAMQSAGYQAANIGFSPSQHVLISVAPIPTSLSFSMINQRWPPLTGQ
ncbi:MAG: hypothetical protein H6993_02865 [Pseudomonadales bacterium]|nr:hypothetical protein [Pseudomonadales bacterium]